MDCQLFDRIVVDLVANHIADFTTRGRALDHARSCPRCRDLLVDQRKLAAALRALSTAAVSEQTSGRVEQALVSAFRARWEEPDLKTTPVAAMPRNWPTARTLWIGVAAALLVATFLTWKWQPTKLRVQPTGGANASPVPQRIPARIATAGSNQSDAAPRIVSRSARRAARRAMRPTPLTAIDETPQTEVVTRFYPLPYGSGLGLDEGWAVVRVQMRRSSLALLGVPVNAGPAASEMLTADVVVGQDGMARGIRFVQ